MGATTTTGTVPPNNGAGGAWANKGPGNNRNVFVPLETPHVVCAGTITTATNAATVTFPTALPEVPANYVVLVTTVDASATARGVSVVSKAGSTTFTGFVLVSEAAAQVVEWAVIRAGTV
jgi:hypothetical protein